MKNIVRKALCVFLMLVLAGSLCINAFAAGEEQYISEIVIAYTEAEKDQLKKEGYDIKPFNLNDGATQLDGKALTGVWMGCKYTANPDEAITDIAVMNMNGGYSFTDYEKVLEKQRENVNKTVERYIVAIDEFRQNYSEERPAAQYAYKVLNLFWENDTDQGLGDFFLSEKTTQAQIETLFLEGNARYLAAAQRIIAIGLADDDSDNIINRIEDADIYDDYGGNLAHINRILYDEIVAIGKEIAYYEEVARANNLAMDPGLVRNYIEENEDKLGADAIDKIQDGFAIKRLAAGIDYAGSGLTLLDIFKIPEDSLTDYWLNPLAAVLTPGQAECLETVGLTLILSTCSKGESYYKQLSIDTDAEIAKCSEPVSVYDGIDRTIFSPDGIALTSDAAKASNNDSGVSWIEGDTSKSSKYDTIATAGLIVGIIAGVVSAFLIGLLVYHVIDHVFWVMANWSFDFAMGFSEAITGLSAGVIAVVTIPLIICIAAFIIYSVFSKLSAEELAKEELYNRHYNHSKMPRIMVTEEADANGKAFFGYYYAVKTVGGEIADINGGVDTNPQWNIIYTTKDGRLGDPIAADIQLTDSAETPAGYSPVHNFKKNSEGERGAYNLNNGVAKTAKELYLYVKHQADGTSEMAGSVFSQTSALLISIAAFVVGGGLAGSIVGAMNKKKRGQTA